MRRMFWVSVGAVAGVAGYRRATALVRSLRPAPRAASLASFTADVREGMALYMERQSARAPSTLEAHARGEPARWPGNSRWVARRATPSRNDELKDGR